MGLERRVDVLSRFSSEWYVEVEVSEITRGHPAKQFWRQTLKHSNNWDTYSSKKSYQFQWNCHRNTTYCLLVHPFVSCCSKELKAMFLLTIPLQGSSEREATLRLLSKLYGRLGIWTRSPIGSSKQVYMSLLFPAEQCFYGVGWKYSAMQSPHCSPSFSTWGYKTKHGIANKSSLAGV